LLELDLSCSCSAIGGGIELHLEGMQAAMPLLRVLELSGLGGFYGEPLALKHRRQNRRRCRCCVTRHVLPPSYCCNATAGNAASLSGCLHLRMLASVVQRCNCRHACCFQAALCSCRSQCHSMQRCACWCKCHMLCVVCFVKLLCCLDMHSQASMPRPATLQACPAPPPSTYADVKCNTSRVDTHSLTAQPPALTHAAHRPRNAAAAFSVLFLQLNSARAGLNATACSAARVGTIATCPVQCCLY
jgi:hypothetical protein